MGRYWISRKAIADLDSIWNYTAEVWSEQQADKYYKMLYESIKGLPDSPGYIEKDYSNVKSGLLGYHIGHHVVFYKRHKDGSIWIDRILHERMDFHRHL